MSNVAVIGGGLVGASAAYHLIRHGAQVTWIDAAHRGQATAAGAGILPPDDHFAPKAALNPLLLAARNYYPRLCAFLLDDGQPNDFYEVVGSLQAARTPTEASTIGPLVKTLQRRREEGFGHIGDVTQLTGKEARKLVPALSENTLSACYAPAAARVSGHRLLARLRASLIRRGVKIVTGVAKPKVFNSRIETLEVGSETIRPDRVLLATGCWSGDFAQSLGIATTVQPERGQLLQLRVPRSEQTCRMPTVLSFQFNYVLWLPDGQVLAGATREPDAAFDATATVRGVAHLLGQTLDLVPGLGTYHFERVRVGLRPITRDGLPLLGAIDGLRDAFIATGHGSFGLETGPISGALVAQQLLGEGSAVPLDAFSNRRFIEKSSPGPLSAIL